LNGHRHKKKSDTAQYFSLEKKIDYEKRFVIPVKEPFGLKRSSLSTMEEMGMTFSGDQSPSLLGGVRILELSSIVAGPLAAALLGDFGPR